MSDQPCGHPAGEIVQGGEGTAYCAACEREACEGKVSDPGAAASTPGSLTGPLVGARNLLIAVLFVLGVLASLAVTGKSDAQRGRHRTTRTTTTRPTTTSTTVSTSTTVTTSTTTTTVPSTARQLGVELPWTSESSWVASMDTFAAEVGKSPSVVEMFRDMTDEMFDPDQMGEISSRGAVPLITIEPNQSLASIAAGSYDAWFTAGAAAAVAYGKPIYLRFAPEMNGPWEPWGPGHATAAQFVAAWRRIHAIFAAADATNVLWVWCPNTLDGAVDFAPYWPGADSVDVLGLDGYNWGTLEAWQTWSQVFGPSYDKLAALDPVKPVMIAETASNENGGNKAAWITSAFMTEIPARTPRVTIVVWFDENKEADWRVESSPASLAAYRAVAASVGWSS